LLKLFKAVCCVAGESFEPEFDVPRHGRIPYPIVKEGD
jgi:hypothetical protein